VEAYHGDGYTLARSLLLMTMMIINITTCGFMTNEAEKFSMQAFTSLSKVGQMEHKTI